MIHILIKLMPMILVLFLGQLQGQEKVWNLKDCLDYTLQNHPHIQQVAYSVNSASWQVKQAKANLLPELNADLNHSYSLGSTINPNTNSRESSNVQYDQFALNLGVDIFNWQNYLNIKLKKLNQASFSYKLEAIQNDLTLEVIQNFFAYQNAKAWQEVLQSQLAGIDEQINRTEKEVEIGIRPKSDIYDIRANMGNVREQFIDAERTVVMTKLNLLQSMNLQDTKVEFELNQNEITLLNPIATELNEIIDHQPQIKVVQKEVEVAEQQIKFNRAGAFPKFTGFYQWSTFYSKILDSENTTSIGDQLDLNKNQYISFGLQIPIFNRLQVKTQTEVAKNYKEKQILTLEREQQKTWTALKQIRNAFEKSMAKYAYIQDNFQNQLLSFERSQEKFNEGLIDAYTFFIIRNNWLSANYNLIQSKHEVLMQQELWKVYLQ